MPLLFRTAKVTAVSKRAITMDELTDKAKGLGNEIAVKAKQQSTGPETRSERHAQKSEGVGANPLGYATGFIVIG